MMVVFGEDANQDDGDGDRDEKGSRTEETAVLSHYQPEAAQISRFSLAASAPAASRKSPPVSRNA